MDSCIDKQTGYDILNPFPHQPPAPPRMHLKDFMHQIWADCKTMLDELKYEKLTRKHQFKDVVPVDVVAVMKQQIECLAKEEALLKKDANLKKEFKDIFKPIPHADMLLTDVYAKICLK
ncbi:hypothetical protein C0995_014789 [Termitomyces sp. Mi166|nr:hypothetical protein C0995_014789 [Termitomyces sp. Mi166\